MIFILSTVSTIRLEPDSFIRLNPVQPNSRLFRHILHNPESVSILEKMSDATIEYIRNYNHFSEYKQRLRKDLFKSFIFAADHWFQIHSFLGAGADGNVFKAFDLEDKNLVAIKFIKLTEKDYKFKNEIKALEIMDQLITFDESEYIIVQKLINGISLFEHIKKFSRRKDFTAEMQILKERYNILREQLYEKGIIHNDLAPRNIIVDDKNQLHVIDFENAEFVSELDRKMLHQRRLDDRRRSDLEWKAVMNYVAFDKELKKPKHRQNEEVYLEYVTTLLKLGHDVSIPMN